MCAPNSETIGAPENNYMCTTEVYDTGKGLTEIRVCQNVKAYNKMKKEEATMKNLIGYEWKEASNGATIEVVNPATQELIDTVPNVTEEDVDTAVKVAEIEQKKWAQISIYERAEKLYKFVDLVEQNKERLATLL